MTAFNPIHLAGIDPAWKPEGKHSAIAFGNLIRNRLVLTEIDDRLFSVQEIIFSINRHNDLFGVSIDASLIIKNETGSRKCEQELTREYIKKKAGCYPTNKKMHGNSTGPILETFLSNKGFTHLSRKSKFVIETYPHTSLIEIFKLNERLLYKKGTVNHRREGQVNLGKKLIELNNHKTLQLIIPEIFQHYFSPKHIKSLKGKALKHNEDVLDAVVCLYTAALFCSGISGVTFMDKNKKDPLDDGYIWVPKL